MKCCYISFTVFTVLCYQKLMPKFTGDDLEIQINPELEEDEKIHVLVTQDETTFQSNDDEKTKE
nr:15518_t:CDS:2 [Entrophospora candida]